MKLRTIAILVVSLISFLSCCDNTYDYPPSRTVLVYMSADNNLSSFASTNISGIRRGTQNNKIGVNNILVYVDRLSRDPLLLDIKDGVIDTVKTYQNSRSAGTAETLSSVIEDVRRLYRSESYGLLLWGHGTGWLPSISDLGTSRAFRPSAIEPYRPTITRSYGSDTNGISMSMKQLQEAIPDGVFDFIMFDACYMANVEVAYSLKDKTKYIISSVAEIWDTGIPYDRIVAQLFSEELETGLKSICDEFYNYYYNNEANRDQSATMSIVKTSELSRLAEETGKILKANKESAETLSLEGVQAFDRPRLFYNNLYPSSPETHILYDLTDYITHIASEEELSLFLDIMEQTVIYEKHTDSMFKAGLDRYPGFDVNIHSGLTIYPYYTLDLPINTNYRHLDWYKKVHE
jgi:Clostripain family.